MDLDNYEPEMVTVTVTCTTPECENEGIPIPIQAAVGGMVMCGPCGTTLTTNVTQEQSPHYSSVID